MFLPYINADISIPDDMHTALIGLQVAAMAKGLRVVDKGFVIDYSRNRCNPVYLRKSSSILHSTQDILGYDPAVR